MNLKKFAVRGIVILAICVALCMFFSGTIRTITTPKVRLTAVKRGKLEEKLELAGKLAFPDAQELGVTLPGDTSIVITKVNSRVGYTVKAGDVLVEARINGYDQAKKQYQDAYDQASEQLLTLQNKNRGLRITRRDEAYADAYFALRDARRKTVSLRMDMEALLSREGLALPEEGYPEGISDAAREAVDAYRAAAQAQAEAQQAMDAAARTNVEESVWTYIVESRDCQDKIDAAEEGLRALMALSDAVSAITAPHDGYLAAMNVKEGDVSDGSQPLCAITAEGGMPVLRADVSELKRSVNEGATVTYGSDWDTVETQVTATGVDAEGRKYVDIALNDALIRARGSVYAMTQEDTPLTLVYRAREATALLPVSAVRGSGDDRYVFVIEQQNAAFGGTVMKLRKMSVTVVAESGGTASVEEELSYYPIAYMEDRPVQEGDNVMEYLN